MPCRIILLLLATIAIAAPQARAGGDLGPPACGKFFDKWDTPGAPPGIIAMGGFGREVMAAQDCLSRNDVATACEHWKRLLPVIDRTGPPLDEQRGAIEKLIQEHSCG